MCKTIDYLGRAPGLDAQEDSSYYDPDDTYSNEPDALLINGMAEVGCDATSAIHRLHSDSGLWDDPLLEEELHHESPDCDS